MRLTTSAILLISMVYVGVQCRPDGGYSYPTPDVQLGGLGGGGSEVEKHIYVHVPPPDPEFQARPPKVVAPPPPKKHYKIVFIKAPTYSPPPAPVIPEVQQHQEKTLIYVLHKNPADTDPIIIPTAKPTQPSKPEVYFIRYKTQKELSRASPSPHTSYLPGAAAGDVFLTSTAAPLNFHHRPAPTPVSILPRHPTPAPNLHHIH